MHLVDRASLSSQQLASIAALVEGHHTLEEVVRWALAETPPRLFARARSVTDAGEREVASRGFDLIVQDEYTSDVVLPFEGELCLVYDTS